MAIEMLQACQGDSLYHSDDGRRHKEQCPRHPRPVASQFEVVAALCRHLARQNRRYDITLRQPASWPRRKRQQAAALQSRGAATAEG